MIALLDFSSDYNIVYEFRPWSVDVGSRCGQVRNTRELSWAYCLLEHTRDKAGIEAGKKTEKSRLEYPEAVAKRVYL